MDWNMFLWIYVSMVVLLSVFGLVSREFTSEISFGGQQKPSAWRVVAAVAVLALLPTLVLTSLVLIDVHVLIAVLLATLVLVMELFVINKVANR